MRPHAAFVIFCTAGGLASAKCTTHTPTRPGSWEVEIHSEPNCGGAHKTINGTMSGGNDKSVDCGCHNIGYFDCDLVSSLTFSPRRYTSLTGVPMNLDVEFWESRGCKGASRGKHTGAWSRSTITGENRVINALRVCFVKA
ncbi:hypothetical protein BV22DRAFT_597540 [Leucogyrophana mollusca]|uniref:Uncharacterized protein n=1 Tax=Leucogyrophana mollusca TaxID=85980 RepID=A0ACB8BCE0_9AGAM|nr:hypothetical protein BV22DRAFT_597540 [Leucogyrophana mollusca]